MEQIVKGQKKRGQMRWEHESRSAGQFTHPIHFIGQSLPMYRSSAPRPPQEQLARGLEQGGM